MALPEYERIAKCAQKPASSPLANIAVVEDAAATGEVAALYDHFRTHFGRPDIPGILKCFATHPPLLRQMMELSESLIFADGPDQKAQGDDRDSGLRRKRVPLLR